MPDPILQQIKRDELFAVFKDQKLVRIMETLLYQVATALPADTTALEAELDAHIADAADAHQASAIGNTPAGSLVANTVQGAINELDAEKQPLDALLTALAALVTAADRLIYTTGVDTVALTTLTAFARTLLDDVDATAARSTLGLVIGTNVQAQDAELSAIAGLASAADTLPYFTGSGTAALATFPAAGRALVATGSVADLSGLGANVATFLATPSSANLIAAVSDETGTGALVFANTPTLVTPVIGVATGTSLAVTGALTSSGTAGVGYAAGAGGTVTQNTDKSTTVVLDKISGEITMDADALAADTAVSFTLTNSTIVATDRLILNHISGGTFMAYSLDAQPGAGSALIGVRNITGGSLSEAIVIGFTVVKSANS